MNLETMPQKRKPLSTTAIAQRWGCTDRHVRNLIKDKQLEAVRIGERKYIVWLDEVERFEKCGWSGTEEDGASTPEKTVNQKESLAGRGIVLPPKSNSPTTGGV